MTRVLILGGTTEARLLAEHLATLPGFEVTVSLAGRTAQAVAHAVPVRVGGFGGAAGLAAYLKAERIERLVDATHPFADEISANAAIASVAAGVPLIALSREPWRAVAGDRWTEVADIPAAIAALGVAPRRVFLALGRKEIAPFATAPQHFYLVRSVDPVEPPLAVPDAAYVVERGPFSEAHDRALMTAHRIDRLICRNSGGEAAYGKIAAARALEVPVIMLQRPKPPDVPTVHRIEDVLTWLAHAGALADARGV